MSLVPGWVGVGAAGINALWYASEGRGADAALSAAGAFPIGKGLRGLGDGEEAAEAATALRGWPEAPDPTVVGHATRHLAPWNLAGRSQFFDGVDVEALADTSSAVGLVQPHGNTLYLMKAETDVGVDATTGLPTMIYTVIRRPDGTPISIYPGASRRS